jgi:hypothetical protein
VEEVIGSIEGVVEDTFNQEFNESDEHEYQEEIRNRHGVWTEECRRLN